jgi:hypothetical protein
MDRGEERAVKRSRRFKAKWGYEVRGIKRKVEKEDKKII